MLKIPSVCKLSEVPTPYDTFISTRRSGVDGAIILIAGWHEELEEKRKKDYSQITLKASISARSLKLSSDRLVEYLTT